MKQNRIFRLLSASVILALMLSLFSTLPVFADDATPPAPTEEPAIPATEEPIATAVPVATTEPVVSEEASVEEVLAQVPTGTEVVVLNEEGQPEPLVSEEAAEVILTSDPMWCPAGQTPGGPGCTAGYTTAAELITALNGVTGDGTIYFMPTYSTNDLTFDHTNVNLSGLNALTIQGGWNGSTGNAFALSGNTIFTGVGLSITNWTSAVTIHDIIVDGAAGIGIYVDTTGDIVLEDVQANNTQINWGQGNYSSGARLDNSSGSGNITVTGENAFNNNEAYGLHILSNGNITLNNVSANNNLGNSSIYIETDGNVVLDHIQANNNEGDEGGVLIENDGDVTVENSQFNENGVCVTPTLAFCLGSGLSVLSSGAVTVNNVVADRNLNIGVDLEGETVYVSNSQFNENGAIEWSTSSFSDPDSAYDTSIHYGDGYGLLVDASSQITLNQVIANMNFSQGAYLYSLSNINVNNSQFNENGSPTNYTQTGWYTDPDLGVLDYELTNNYEEGTGLVVWASDTISLNQVSANGNSAFGTEVYSTPSSVIILNSQFNGNGSVGNYSLFETNHGSYSYSDSFNWDNGQGLHVEADNSIYIENSQASNNNGLGAFIGSFDPVSVNIICSTFNNNTGHDNTGIGIIFSIPGTANLFNVEFAGNTTDFDIYGGGSYNIETGKCDSAKDTVESPALPWNLVTVSNGQQVDLDCTLYRGTKLILPNGNSLYLPCPIGDEASLTDNPSGDLPGPLPAGNTFQSAFTTAVSEKGEKLGKLSSYATISFMIPEGVNASSLAILFWNGTEWVNVENTFVTEGIYFEAFVNYTGTFILVQK